MSDAVLDTIDHALADYALSCDAMRWTPDPPEPEPWRDHVQPQGSTSLVFRGVEMLGQVYCRVVWNYETLTYEVHRG